MLPDIGGGFGSLRSECRHPTLEAALEFIFYFSVMHYSKSLTKVQWRKLPKSSGILTEKGKSRGRVGGELEGRRFGRHCELLRNGRSEPGG